jgi:hypothetical protein
MLIGRREGWIGRSRVESWERNSRTFFFCDVECGNVVCVRIDRKWIAVELTRAGVITAVMRRPHKGLRLTLDTCK